MSYYIIHTMTHNYLWIIPNLGLLAVGNNSLDELIEWMRGGIIGLPERFSVFWVFCPRKACQGIPVKNSILVKRRHREDNAETLFCAIINDGHA